MHDIPPERWLHQLNQRYPNLWAGMRKYYNDPQKYLLPVYRDHLRDIPSWCPMPGIFPEIYLAHKYGDDTFAQHRGMAESLQTMYLWRAGKGVYRFAPELYDALVAQPLKGDDLFQQEHSRGENAMTQFIQALSIDWSRISPDSYLRSIPAIASLDYLPLRSNVVFFVGENATGKSTLLEGLATAYGFNPEGGTLNYRFTT